MSALGIQLTAVIGGILVILIGLIATDFITAHVAGARNYQVKWENVRNSDDVLHTCLFEGQPMTEVAPETYSSQAVLVPTRNSALDFSLHDNGLSMWKDAGADVILTGDSASTILPSVQPHAPLLNRRIHGVQSRSAPSAPCLEPGGACVRAELNWAGLTWHRWSRSTRRRAVNFGSRVAQYRASFSDSADFSAHLTAGTDPILLLSPLSCPL